MPTFDWAESPGSSVEYQPRVIATRFGDGYEQRADDGLNPLGEAWDLSFNDCGAAAADQIVAFLRDGMGRKTFDWTPPRATLPRKWKCTSLRRTLGAEIDTHNISARFERVDEA